MPQNMRSANALPLNDTIMGFFLRFEWKNLGIWAIIAVPGIHIHLIVCPIYSKSDITILFALNHMPFLKMHVFSFQNLNG